jgi:polyhydroxybutyrate depolymerase
MSQRNGAGYAPKAWWRAVGARSASRIRGCTTTYDDDRLVTWLRVSHTMLGTLAGSIMVGAAAAPPWHSAIRQESGRSSSAVRATLITMEDTHGRSPRSLPRWSRWVLAAVLVAVTVAGAGVVLDIGSHDRGAKRAAAVGCAGASAPPTGDGEHTFSYDGTDRSYLLARPTGATAGSARPLLLNFHGSGGNMSRHEANTAMASKGTARGYVVVTPDALGDPRQWNWRPGRQQAGPDDFNFVLALVADLRQRLCIDPDRIYLTGHSNGSAFAALLACRSPQTFAAFAMVSAAVPVTCRNDPSPAPLAIHGTADQVPYDGSTAQGGRRLPAVPDVAKGYAEHNMCDLNATHETTFVGVERTRYTKCVNGGDVVLDTVIGGTHSWPGGTRTSADQEDSVAGKTFDATGAILDFFDANRRRSS